jgi:hypothetical protein
MSGLRFKEVEILEVSPTSVPANADAMVVGKSLSGRADRVCRATELRRGHDARSSCTPEAGTLDFGGTLADRKWQAELLCQDLVPGVRRIQHPRGKETRAPL